MVFSHYATRTSFLFSNDRYSTMAEAPNSLPRGGLGRLLVRSASFVADPASALDAEQAGPPANAGATTLSPPGPAPQSGVAAAAARQLVRSYSRRAALPAPSSPVATGAGGAAAASEDDPTTQSSSSSTAGGMNLSGVFGFESDVLDGDDDDDDDDAQVTFRKRAEMASYFAVDAGAAAFVNTLFYFPRSAYIYHMFLSWRIDKAAGGGGGGGRGGVFAGGSDALWRSSLQPDTPMWKLLKAGGAAAAGLAVSIAGGVGMEEGLLHAVAEQNGGQVTPQERAVIRSSRVMISVAIPVVAATCAVYMAPRWCDHKTA